MHPLTQRMAHGWWGLLSRWSHRDQRCLRVRLAALAALPGISLLLICLICTAPSAAAETSATGPACIWHTVVPGDTLGDLGWAYRTTAMTIAQFNHIVDPELIYVGQRLCIPLPSEGSVSPARPPQHAPATHPPAPPPMPSGSSARGVQAFIHLVLPYARAAHKATGWPTSLILAQWGLEQGWRVPGYTGYNFGNCGAVPGEPLVPGLSVPGSPAAFAYAPTPQDGLRIYVAVAHLKFYIAVSSAAAHAGVDAAARALGQSPWDAAPYTARGGKPGSSLIYVLHTYNLYRYDSR